MHLLIKTGGGVRRAVIEGVWSPTEHSAESGDVRTGHSANREQNNKANKTNKQINTCQTNLITHGLSLLHLAHPLSLFLSASVIID